MTRCPPATSVSLFAVATTLPAASAARTGRRDTTPPVPTITRSTSSRVASATSASSPRTRVDAAREGRGPRPRPRAATASGRSRATCASSSRGVAAGRERRRPGTGPACASRTSTVCVPMLPVEPEQRDAERRVRPGQAAEQERGHTARPPGAANRNESIRSSMPPWPGMSVAGVLLAGGPLEHRLGEVAGLGREAEHRPEDERPQRAAGRAPASRSAVTIVVATSPPITPSMDLDGRDVGQELVAPDLPPDEERAGVEAPHAEDRAAGPSRAPRRATRAAAPAGTAGPSAGDVEDERDEPDVDRAEHRRDPDDQAVARVGPRERADPRQHGARPRRAGSPCRRRVATTASSTNGDREHRPEHGERRVAAPAQQPERLPRPDRRDDGQEDRRAPGAE